MTETPAPTISDAAVEEVAEAIFSRGDAGLIVSANPELYRADARAAIEAAYPFIAAEVRRQFRDELIEAAEAPNVTKVIADFVEVHGEMACISQQLLTVWLREQGDRS